MAQLVKNPPAMQKTPVRSLGWEDPLEEGVASHSSILAGESPWTEKPGRLQLMGSVTDFISWAPKSLKLVTEVIKLKDVFSLEEKL